MKVSVRLCAVLTLAVVVVVQTTLSDELDVDETYANYEEDGHELDMALKDEIVDQMDPESDEAEPEMLEKRARGNCPRGFEYLAETSSCYNLIKTERSWTNANAHCKEYGPKAHLLFIETSQEQNVIASWLEPKSVGCSKVPEHSNLGRSFWTGGQRANERDGKSRFYWKTPSGTRRDMKYATWKRYEPNNYKKRPESCVSLSRGYDYKWNDLYCWCNLCYVCEIDV